MIEREEINGLIFIAQTKYMIYRSEEDLQKDGNHAVLTTSDKAKYEANKKLAREKEEKGDSVNQFIVF